MKKGINIIILRSDLSNEDHEGIHHKISENFLFFIEKHKCAFVLHSIDRYVLPLFEESPSYLSTYLAITVNLVKWSFKKKKNESKAPISLYFSSEMINFIATIRKIQIVY